MLRVLAVLVLILQTTSARAQQIVYVDRSASGAETGDSWDDAYRSLQDALFEAGAGDEIWVSRGTYLPDAGGGHASGDRDASFTIDKAISIYGGFAGAEVRREERDWATNETILSGDLQGNDVGAVSLEEPSRVDNSFHVVTATWSGEPAAVFDGFTITSGHADGTPVENTAHGGGLRLTDANIHLRNLRISRNAGDAGAGIFASGSRIVLEKSRIIGNVGSGFGGGVYSYHGELSLAHVDFENNRSGRAGAFGCDRCTATILASTFVRNRASFGGAAYMRMGEQLLISTSFYGNVAGYMDGGALFLDESSTELSNVLISGNEAQNSGGGMFVWDSELQATNLTVAQNVALGQPLGGTIWIGTGGGIASLQSSTSLANSILWSNTAVEGDAIVNVDGSVRVSHSIIEGGVPSGITDEGGMSSEDPLFRNPAGPDGIAGTIDDVLEVEGDSPAIDTGDNSALPIDALDADGDGDSTEPLPIDLLFRQRIYNGGRADVVDIGVYEYGAPVVVVIEEHPIDNRRRIPFNFSVYPNPFNSELFIRIVEPVLYEGRVQMFDMLGRLRQTSVFRAEPGNQEMRISFGTLENGCYFVRLSSNRTDQSDGKLVCRVR